MAWRDRTPDDGRLKKYDPEESRKRLEESINSAKSQSEPQIDYLGRLFSFVGILGMAIGTVGTIYEVYKPNNSADYNEWYGVALVVASGFVMLKGIKRIAKESSSNSNLENKLENE
ncbi:MAG: hypothetical protein AABX39_00600 [Nanoarchaeota archaeon]